MFAGQQQSPNTSPEGPGNLGVSLSPSFPLFNTPLLPPSHKGTRVLMPPATTCFSLERSPDLKCSYPTSMLHMALCRSCLEPLLWKGTAADPLIQTKASGTDRGSGQKMRIEHKLKKSDPWKTRVLPGKKNVLFRGGPARSGGHTRAPEVIPYPAIAVWGWKEGRPAAILA